MNYNSDDNTTTFASSSAGQCVSRARSAGELAAVSEHGVLLEQLGVAGGGTLPLHQLGYEEGDAAGASDNQTLPHKVECHQE